MTLNPLYASHIGRVAVGFVISAPELDPDDVTSQLGLNPSSQARAGDDRLSFSGTRLGVEDEGYWRLDSGASVDSKDVNDHLRHLLNVLLPHRDAVRKLACSGETYFDVLWESSYLYAGTGPVIDADCVTGMAQLGAGLGFDIYQIEASSEEADPP